MTNDAYPVFNVAIEDVFDGLRRLSRAEVVPPDVAAILRESGLGDGDRLSVSGLALFKLRWVLRDTDEAHVLLGLALRKLLAVQVLEQELLQFGAIPEQGAIDLLVLHRAAPSELSVETARRTFRQLALVGLVVYSSKYKTVRASVPPAEEVRAGEARVLAAMISPKTPYMNVVRLRRILRTLTGVVWWADRHFGARAFEELAEELDATVVRQVRILSGTGPTVLTDRSLSDFKRFREEMGGKAIHAEWRVDSAASDWHDRWLVDDRGAFNMPPVNTLFKNDHSEMLPTTARPPLDAWWARAMPR